MMTLQKFQELYHHYQESGLTVRAFCSNEGLGESGFYYWQQKLRRLPAGSGSFMPVVLQPSGCAPVSGNKTFNLYSQGGSPVLPSCEISYPNGIQVKLHGSIDPQFIRSLI